MTSAARPSMIAVDWGSTSFRAYLLDQHHQLLAKVASDQGVLQHDRAHHAEVLREQCGPWLLQTPDLPIYMSGVVGARDGWLEMPYVPCPASLDDVRGLMTRVENRFAAPLSGADIWIAPGVSGCSPSGAPDVMRGEEIQVFGALESLGTDTGTVCLPGTHSKWVQVENAAITGFSTFMTGELYALIAARSSVGAIGKNARDDRRAFAAAVSAAGEEGGLLHQLFSIRARHLTGHLPEQSVLSYLSGLVIGNEVKAAKALYPAAQTVAVVANEVLSQRYCAALSQLQLQPRSVSADGAFLRGIIDVAAREITSE